MSINGIREEEREFEVYVTYINKMRFKSTRKIKQTRWMDGGQA